VTVRALVAKILWTVIIDATVSVVNLQSQWKAIPFAFEPTCFAFVWSADFIQAAFQHMVMLAPASLWAQNEPRFCCDDLVASLSSQMSLSEHVIVGYGISIQKAMEMTH
jgi:hypothetical protein